MTNAANPLAVRPTALQQTKTLEVWFSQNGDSVAVLDRERGHAVYVEAGSIRIWIEDGGHAPVYEYLQWNPESRMYMSDVKDGERWVWVPRAGEGVRKVVVDVPFHRFGDEWHWNTREAVAAAIKKRDQAREGWYTVG